MRLTQIGSSPVPNEAPELSASDIPFTGEPRNSSNAFAKQTHSIGQMILGLWLAMRPHQWIKNLLVVAAPVAAWGAEIHSPALTFQSCVPLVYAFVSFCLAASAIYLFNDARDVEADRQHPQKQYRPVAAGMISSTFAMGASFALIAAALALSILADYELTVVIAVYIVIQFAYCLGLKNQPVIDIAIVSSGFLMRAIAGGVSVHIPLSRWFLLVMAFGSLFMAAGKRYAELYLAEQTGVKIRKSLQYYTSSYLRFVWILAATAVVIFYGMWALDGDKSENVFYAMSIAPFTIAILRYAIDIDGADAGAPEEIALHDKVLQVLALLWIGTVGAAIFIS